MFPINRAQISEQYKRAKQFHAAGRLAEAKALYQSLRVAAPKMAELPFQLARIAEATGAQTQAADLYAEADALKPGEPMILQALSQASQAAGDLKGALSALDRLIALTPKAIKPQAEKAAYLQRLGEFDAAEKIYRRLLKAHPLDGELYRVFLGTKKLTRGDKLLRDMQNAWKHAGQSDESRMHLGFALGKALSETGEADKVFGYLDVANALQRKYFPYDPAEYTRDVDALLAAQDGADISAATGTQALRPIFVIGMPRSGTTLVEQIIASHSDVTAGGELTLFPRLAFQAVGGPRDMTPLRDIAPDKLAMLARTYADAVMRMVGVDSGIVTDKSIQTYLVLGLLRRALPGAQFVIVHRDPRDVALSIYRNYFENGVHRYSNSLPDIAHYVKTFHRVIAFWRDRMPGAFHEVRYEDLVANPEAQSRALIAAVGLDWQDACLEFHKHAGDIRTLSLHQVRQPIYQTSAAAWKRYEADLAPFIDAMKEP
ncbi:tetratricopeptide repeat-containing sulfotransferase family protein [Primorskyibacter flagellatus]|uniref:tetratricopeptide repeat-containing sulfotransferase family protein n=1 Tax=Primorskyibacter flagellatus TaxID=1387277 RepID=UPI003A913A19